jgi:glycosyltransferase involved in cell wall biosynthesis
MTRLSLIIPCYNCEATLDEAVASIYRQESPIPFDVTMVDDGSTDATFEVMRRLSTKYPNVRLVRHAVNLGGGAARNTAVANSTGDVIFCLDSDDMMGADFLRNLVGFWLEKRSDGIGIGTSIKFKKSNIRDVAYVTKFTGPGQRIRFESLLDGSECSLMSTFLITRDAFDRIGGYPTSHGFDTQGMAWRFLANGLTAYTCPDAVYHHRVSFHRSYFIREDRAGRYNWNWLLILSEFLYLFDDKTKDMILGADLVPNGTGPTIEGSLRMEARRRDIYVPHYRDLIQMGRDRSAVDLTESRNRYDQYWLGEYWLSRDEPLRALQHFRMALEARFPHWILVCRLVEAQFKAFGVIRPFTFAYPGMNIHVSKQGLAFEAVVPRLSAYQRFENWLMRRASTRPCGRVLKQVRLGFRRKPEQVRVGS